MLILRVDDERWLLASLTRALRVHRPAWVVTTANNGEEAMSILKAQDVDLLITDIQMPGMDGMALLAQVRRDSQLARLPLILISAENDRSSVRKGMTSGADDYLTKPFTVEELILSVESRLRRLDQGQEQASQIEFFGVQLAQLLTDRELEVLALLGQGLVPKDIAAALKLSPKTVSAHRQNIMSKLDVHNAAALAALAIHANIA
jgi:DNA-binding NarL/FixJ family response regulator